MHCVRGPARRGAARRRTPSRRSWPAPTRRCAPSAWTSRSPTAAPAPTWCTRTPGTPTSPATSPSLLYGIPHVVTRPLAGAAAAVEGRAARRRLRACPRWAERTSYLEAAARSSRCPAAMRDDVLRCYPDDRPRPRARRPQRHRHRRLVARRPTTDRVRALGVDPDRPVGRLRRPDHPAEGRCRSSCARPRAAAARRSSSCSARAPRTPRRSRPRSRGWSRSSPRRADGVVWIREMLPRPDVVAAADRRHRRSPARRSTSRSASSTWRRWPARPRSSPPPPAASPRSSSHGETGLLVPIEQATDGTGTPLDPEQYVADFARRAHRGRRRPRPRPRVRRRGPSARRGGLRLGRHRRADAGALPLARLTWTA